MSPTPQPGSRGTNTSHTCHYEFTLSPHDQWSIKILTHCFLFRSLYLPGVLNWIDHPYVFSPRKNVIPSWATSLLCVIFLLLYFATPLCRPIFFNCLLSFSSLGFQSAIEKREYSSFNLIRPPTTRPISKFCLCIEPCECIINLLSVNLEFLNKIRTFILLTWS